MNDCVQACCQPTRVKASDCVHNYTTKTGNSHMLMCFICFAGIKLLSVEPVLPFSFLFGTANFFSLRTIFLSTQSVSLLRKLVFSRTIPMPGTQLMLLPQQFLYWSKWKLTCCQGGLTQLQMTSTPICLVSQSTACPLLVLPGFDMVRLLLSHATVH